MFHAVIAATLLFFIPFSFFLPLYRFCFYQLLIRLAILNSNGKTRKAREGRWRVCRGFWPIPPFFGNASHKLIQLCFGRFWLKKDRPIFVLKSLPYKSFLFPPLTVNPVFGEMNSAELATFLVSSWAQQLMADKYPQKGGKKKKKEEEEKKKRKSDRKGKKEKEKKIRERMKEEGGGCMRLPEPSGFLKNPAASCAWRND